MTGTVLTVPQRCVSALVVCIGTSRSRESWFTTSKRCPGVPSVHACGLPACLYTQALFNAFGDVKLLPVRCLMQNEGEKLEGAVGGKVRVGWGRGDPGSPREWGEGRRASMAG